MKHEMYTVIGISANAMYFSFVRQLKGFHSYKILIKIDKSNFQSKIYRTGMKWAYRGTPQRHGYRVSVKVFILAIYQYNLVKNTKTRLKVRAQFE